MPRVCGLRGGESAADRCRARRDESWSGRGAWRVMLWVVRHHSLLLLIKIFLLMIFRELIRLVDGNGAIASTGMVCTLSLPYWMTGLGCFHSPTY